MARLSTLRSANQEDGSSLQAILGMPMLTAQQRTYGRRNGENRQKSGPSCQSRVKGESSLCSLAWPSLGQRGPPRLASFDVQFLVGEPLARPAGSLRL